MNVSYWLGNALLAGGVAFTVIGSLGLLRLPDFYTRAHAAGKPDTMGVVLSVLGLAVLEGGLLTVTGVKLVLIAAFLAVANPVTVHVLSQAAMRTGLRPWSRRA